MTATARRASAALASRRTTSTLSRYPSARRGEDPAVFGEHAGRRVPAIARPQIRGVRRRSRRRSSDRCAARPRAPSGSAARTTGRRSFSRILRARHPRIGVALVAARGARAAQRGDRRGGRDLEQVAVELVARAAQAAAQLAGARGDRAVGARRATTAAAGRAGTSSRRRSRDARTARGAPARARSGRGPPPTVSAATFWTSARPSCAARRRRAPRMLRCPGTPDARSGRTRSGSAARRSRSRARDRAIASRPISVSSVHGSWPERVATSMTSAAPVGAIRSSATAVVLPRPPPRSTPMNLENARCTRSSPFVARSPLTKCLVALAFGRKS